MGRAWSAQNLDLQKMPQTYCSMVVEILLYSKCIVWSVSLPKASISFRAFCSCGLASTVGTNNGNAADL